MDVSLLANTIRVVAAQQGLGFANMLLLDRPNFVSNANANAATISDSPADQSSGFLHVSAAIFDAISSPPVRCNARRTARRTLLRKKRRTRRKTGGDSEDGGGEELWFFGADGGSPFDGVGGGWGGRGGGGGGGGGGGWNFGKFGGKNWESSSSWWWSSSNFAYGFIYEVIYWIALSNCVHFAMKKVVRIVADGIGDAEREKVVPMRLTSVC